MRSSGCWNAPGTSSRSRKRRCGRLGRVPGDLEERQHGDVDAVLGQGLERGEEVAPVAAGHDEAGEPAGAGPVVDVLEHVEVDVVAVGELGPREHGEAERADRLDPAAHLAGVDRGHVGEDGALDLVVAAELDEPAGDRVVAGPAGGGRLGPDDLGERGVDVRRVPDEQVDRAVAGRQRVHRGRPLGRRRARVRVLGRRPADERLVVAVDVGGELLLGVVVHVVRGRAGPSPVQPPVVPTSRQPSATSGQLPCVLGRPLVVPPVGSVLAAERPVSPGAVAVARAGRRPRGRRRTGVVGVAGPSSPSSAAAAPPPGAAGQPAAGGRARRPGRRRAAGPAPRAGRRGGP